MLFWTLLAIFVAMTPLGGMAGAPVWSSTAAALVAYLAGVVVLGKVYTALSIRDLKSREAGQDVLLSKRLARRSTFIKASLVVGYAVLCYGFDWHAVGAEAGRLTAGVLLDEAVVLAPFLAGIAIYLWTSYPLNINLRGLGLKRVDFLLFVLRHEVGLALVPLLVLVVMNDLVSLALPDNVDLSILLTLALAAVFLAVLGPVLLCRLWRTRPMPSGPMRQRLEAMCARAKLKYRDIMLWETREAVHANAAVIGFWGRFRYILISDGLLKTLSPEEVEAVCGHEIGHVVHRHMLYYLFLALGFGIYYMFVSSVFVELFPGTFSRATPDSVGASGMVQGAAFLGFAVIYWGGLFGFFSRRFEREADIFAAKMVGDYNLCAQALESIGRVNGLGRFADSWRHFSIAKRVGYLQQLAAKPELAKKYARDVRSLIAAHAVGISLAIVLLIMGLGGGE